MGAVGAPQRSSFLERNKLSSEHVIVVEKVADFRWSEPDLKVITAEQFVAEQPDDRGRLRKVTNLCRNYGYLSMGYYCSLLAEARGDRPGIGGAGNADESVGRVEHRHRRGDPAALFQPRVVVS